MDIHPAASSTYELPENKCAVLLGVENISTLYLLMHKDVDIESVTGMAGVQSAIQQHFAPIPEPVPIQPVKEPPKTTACWVTKADPFPHLEKNERNLHLRPRGVQNIWHTR